MMLYLLYVITGAIGGFVGGFLGLGGGIIFVPSLFYIFTYLFLFWAVDLRKGYRKKAADEYTNNQI